MKRVVKAANGEAERRAFKNVYKKAQELLDAIEGLPTGTVDRLGDFGVVYEDLIDFLPGFHVQLFGENEYEED